MAIFAHVTVGTNDLVRARTFYGSVLAPLGYKRLNDLGDNGSVWGESNCPQRRVPRIESIELAGRDEQIENFPLHYPSQGALTMTIRVLVLLMSLLLAAPTVMAQVMETLKERLSDKASDAQRVDNCRVPVERRGTKPRPDCPAQPPAATADSAPSTPRLNP